MGRNGLPKEIKFNAVKEYLEGKGGTRAIAERYGVYRTTLEDWIHLYQIFGDSAFDNERNSAYSSSLKEQAVKDYLAGRGSLSDICKKYKIKSDKQLRNWILKYNNHEELSSYSGGTGRIMVKGRKTTFEERVDIVKDYLESGSSYEEIAEKYEISYQQIYQWARKFKEEGIDGLQDRRGRKKPEEMLTEADRLRAELKLERAKNRKLEAENLFLKKLKEIERRRY